ncbi:MAG: amidohydrolase family protein [Parvibaculaceae bacterium]
MTITTQDNKPTRPLIIDAGAVLDGTGARARPGQSILVVGERIAAIGASQDIRARPDAAGATVVDARDATLLPGLIDGHLHIGWRSAAEIEAERNRDRLMAWMLGSAHAALLAGITTIRDAGAPLGVTIAFKRALAEGLHTAPRLQTCGPSITTTAGHATFLGETADTADELRKWVRRLAAEGVDLIKIMASGGSIDPETNRRRAQYSEAELRYAVEDAHRLRLPVLAHANATESIRNAVRAGVDVIAHCNWLAPAEGRIEYDARLSDEMAERGVFVDLNIEGGWRPLAEADASAEEWENGPRTRWELLDDMRRRGVKIFFTSDEIGPLVGTFPSLLLKAHDYLGIAIEEVIWRATGLAAEGIGLAHELGTIAPGKRADLLLVSGMLQENPAALLKVRSVYRDGVRVVHERQLAPSPFLRRPEAA